MERVYKYIPLYGFIIIAFFTNILGVLLLILGPQSYWEISYLFSGVTLPDIYYDDLFKYIIVTFGCIALMLIGYALGLKLSKKAKRVNKKEVIAQEEKCQFFWIIMYFGIWIFLMIKILSIIDIFDVTAWFNNNQLYNNRMRLLEHLSFFDLVLSYTVMPMLLGQIYQLYGTVKKKIFCIGVLAYAILNAYLFQKRPLVTGLIYLFFVIFVYNKEFIEKMRKGKIVLICLSMCSALYLIYDAGIILNTVSQLDDDAVIIAQTESELIRNDEGVTDDETKNEITLESPIRSFSLETHYLDMPEFYITQIRALVGFLNRTAYQSIVDIVAFPDFYSFYHIDLGLDMIGIGSMPDENIVAAKLLYPGEEEPGAFPTPYYIVLYTQGGIWVPLVGGFLVGIFMGLIWNILLNAGTNESRLLMALGGIFSINIAIGSGRDALLSSSGFLWPCLFLGLCILVCRIISRIVNRKKRYKK